MSIKGESFTTYGWIVCVWVLVVSFQYGFHISALNQIQAVLTCKATGDFTPLPDRVQPDCIPMTDATFSVVTSVFTFGGLLGSSVANILMDRWGRRGAVRASAFCVALGAGLMAMSASLGPLLLGRLLCGVGAGFGLCVGPIFLSEMAPTTIKGRVGVLTQLSIVFGIFATQAMGLRLATPTQWRLVLYFSSHLAVAQLLASPFMVESPAWLSRRSLHEEQKSSARKLWGNTDTRADPSPADVEDALLRDFEDEGAVTHTATVTIPQLFKAPELRRPLYIVSLAMTAQQVSGINAVMYYSNDILSKSLPEWGPYISLSITVVNVIMTFPAIFLIERIGRKVLLQLSVAGATVSLLAVGLGLDTGVVIIASVAILTFVTSFASGLGPVPFVMIPEVSPIHAVSALSSVGLSLNWTANFFVGLVFLPIRNLLAGGDPMKEGRVFYVFAALLFTCTLALSMVYRG